MFGLGTCCRTAMSRLYDTEAASNLILSDDSEAESDGELAEPMCPGSDEEFHIDIDSCLVSNRGTNKIDIQI